MSDGAASSASTTRTSCVKRPKIVLAPDSFKGTLSARDAALALERGVRRALPDAETVLLPLADGGEGTVAAIHAALGGVEVPITVTGPLGDPVDASFLFLEEGRVAVMEMAAAAGITLISAERLNPLLTTTYGVGELLLAAVRNGAQRIVIGIGGSATNDGGLGAMQALGVRFLGAHGVQLAPLSGGALASISSIDTAGLLFPAGSIPITIAADVTNPLTGPAGASAVYGPQKGATPEMVATLDAGLRHYAALIRRDLGRDVEHVPSAGAAGGLGAALMAFLNATVQSGIDVVLDLSNFDRHAADADWVLTGEGRIDEQTLHGKTIAGVLARCRQLNVPKVAAFGGSVMDSARAALRDAGLAAAVQIHSPDDPEITPEKAARELEEAAEEFARSIIAAV